MIPGRWLFILFCAGAATYGQDTHLRVEVQATQPTVIGNKPFPVSTTIRNAGAKEQVLQVWTCSCVWQWSADNPAVEIKSVPCLKNSVVSVRLKPGETYVRDRSLAIRTAAANSGTAVIFQLDSHPDAKENRAVQSVIWSNALSLEAAR